MSSDLDISSICAEIAKSYSPCDVSDALLKLQVPYAGYLRDISPLPTRHGSNTTTTRLVGPVSPVLFVLTAHSPGTGYDGMLATTDSNLPADHPFSDLAPKASVV